MRSIFLFIALAVMAFSAAVASANPVLLDLKLLQAGESLAEPKLMVEPGIAAVIELDARIRLEVRTLTHADGADTQFRLLQERNGVFLPVATPRVLSELGKEVSVEMTTDRGETLRLVFTASVADRSTGLVRERQFAR
jgi:hypothetical protein